MMTLILLLSSALVRPADAASPLGNSPPTEAYFVFDNRSGVTTLVSYTLKEKQEWPALTTPALARSARGEGGWRELRPEEYLSSSDGRTRTIEVRTGESLRVAVIKGYPGHGMKGLWKFPVESLEIAEAKPKTATSLHFARCEVLLAFERWDDSLFVFQVQQAKGVPPI